MENQTRTISNAMIVTIEQAEKYPDILLRVQIDAAEKCVAHGGYLEKEGANAVLDMIIRQCAVMKHCGRSYTRFLELVIQQLAEFFDEA